MAKWFGVVGYAKSYEDRPGVWKDEIVEREYFGDILQNYRSLNSNDRVVDDFNINNKVSIISDPYAMDNFHDINYASFMGAKWKVTNVEVLYPRLILTLGGVYNGE
jgi:hypothetical protein